jgi:RNA polymerase sigma-70 factor (ECF subfamily)
MQSATFALHGVVERVRTGDVGAFALIYEEYASRIHSHAYRLLGNRHDADDVTQETFLRAFRSISRLADEERIGSWLFAIASNICLDTLRRRRIISWLPLTKGHEDIADPRGDLSGTVAESELVRQALAKLSLKDALCLVLRDVEGFSCQEIGEITGFSQPSIWTRLSRARTKFAAAYAALSPGSGEANR